MGSGSMMLPVQKRMTMPPTRSSQILTPGFIPPGEDLVESSLWVRRG